MAERDLCACDTCTDACACQGGPAQGEGCCCGDQCCCTSCECPPECGCPPGCA